MVGRCHQLACFRDSVKKVGGVYLRVLKVQRRKVELGVQVQCDQELKRDTGRETIQNDEHGNTTTKETPSLCACLCMRAWFGQRPFLSPTPPSPCAFGYLRSMLSSGEGCV
jgi:hypothetical protein